ncbi:MAG: hypothetical protein QG656_2746 [Candidatus Hydrogenedentes bacterium]|nr:hypothetical protein [Candidatus Hydrogenedentota bacterium]
MFESFVAGMLTAGLVLLAGSAAAAPLTVAYDDDGTITVNGERTLIVGTYYTADSDQPYAELSEAGFNLVHTGADRASMDEAQAAGLMTWVTVGTLDPKDPDGSAAKLVAAVNAVKDHPSLALIESVDEPAWTWMKPEQRIPAEVFSQAYPVIKQADPNHLLYMNHAPTNLVKTLQAYNAGTDVVAMDIYPVNPGGLKSMFALFEDGYQGDLNNEQISQVGEYVDKMRRVTGPSRPLLMVLQGFAWENLVEPEIRRDEKILYPTYAQTRFMAFQSLIKGANGIVYWGTQTTPQPSQCWTDLKRVVREVADLAKPLSLRTVNLPIEIEYHEMGRSVDDGVQMLVKDYDGKRFVFTCNADKNLCKATLPGLGEWATCQVLHENDRTLPVENGAITDTWKRFEVHVYELRK